MQGAVRGRRVWVALVACLGFGLVFAASLEARGPSCGGRPVTIASNDRLIHGTRGPDVILGGRGPNTIRGAGGNDVICGGRGRDRIDGGRGKDAINGRGDADLVRGGRGSDVVDGGAGRDKVRGDSGNDRVHGGPGRRDDVDGGMGDDVAGGGRGSFDLVSGGIGSDRIDGGPGAHDVASYRSAGGPIEVDLGNGRVTGAEDERLIRIEDVIGGPGGDGCFELPLVVQRCSSSSLALSGSAGDDDLVVGYHGDRYVVASGSGTALQLRNARRITTILVSLGAGNDAIVFDRSVPAKVSTTVDGGPGSDSLRGGRGEDVIYAGDDADPDRLAGGGGGDALFGVNILHPRRPSGAATMVGGGGDDLLIGGQPCDGDRFVGGGGSTDSASFARVRNDGTFVEARIGGPVLDPDVAGCKAGYIVRGTEKIEGSPGPDVLAGMAGVNTLLGRGGSDRLDGRGGIDRCIGGRGGDRIRSCEYARN
jgi:Ca2+-binding RTX toxin-like protein